MPTFEIVVNFTRNNKRELARIKTTREDKPSESDIIELCKAVNGFFPEVIEVKRIKNK